MKTVKTRSLKKIASGPCVAFLALSMTFGVSAVQADSETSVPSLQEMFLNPIMDLVHAVEARLANLESTIVCRFFQLPADDVAGTLHRRPIRRADLHHQ